MDLTTRIAELRNSLSGLDSDGLPEVADVIDSVLTRVAQHPSVGRAFSTNAQFDRLVQTLQQTIQSAQMQLAQIRVLHQQQEKQGQNGMSLTDQDYTTTPGIDMPMGGQTLQIGDPSATNVNIQAPAGAAGVNVQSL